jgi:acetyl-CoA carboxylase beta subunit
MAQFDMRNNAEFGLGLSATLSGTTAAAGDWIDMQGWEALTFSVSTGTVTDAGTTSGFSFEVQESDTTAAADATAVADADLVGLESALTVTDDDADDTLVGSIGYVGGKRYVRIVATGTTGTDAAVTVHARKDKGAVMATATIDAGTAAT